MLSRILLVNDSQAECDALVHMVSAWGYSVEVARNGADALADIQRQEIQLILADWLCLGMSMTAFCSKIRRINSERYSYIMLMSAQADGEFLVNALEVGADDVLYKPIDGNELEARFQSAVRRMDLHAQLKQQTEELAHAHDVITQDLKTVSGLQRSYLPAPQSPYPDLSYQWLSVPSKYVSGDHLNVFQLQDHLYGFYLLDVSGHGISAAVKSMQLVQFFSDHSNESVLFDSELLPPFERRPSKPSQVVARLNRLFQQTDTDLSYFTMIYGVINTTNRQVSFCQAGHPSPVLLHQDGTVQVLGNGGYPVGLFDAVQYQDVELELAQGQALLLYSDGVIEVQSAQQETFGEARLLHVVSHGLRAHDRRAVLPSIEHAIQTWGGDPVLAQGFHDDVSLLMLSLEALQGGNAVEEAMPVSEPVFQIQEESQPVSKQGALAAKKPILIVDDSRSFLKLFEVMLSNWGLQVYTATNGQEALELIERVQPAFVLTDWDMPSMSGIELCNHVRSKKQNAYMYMIMITGYASRDDLLHSLRMGADDFLTKPVSPSELKVRLKTAERIADLHISLQQRHEQLLQLYEALRHDMREVARIQHALLPKHKTEPWPCAVHTVYRPSDCVCGMQIGLLDTQPNEFGFFMVVLPGNDVSAALQAMALSRWLSMAQAMKLLCTQNGQGNKQQRFLADPQGVCEEIKKIAPTCEVLYGLLNVAQGTLWLAGFGHWSVVLSQASDAVFVHDAPQALGGVIFQGALRPGATLYCGPTRSARALGFDQLPALRPSAGGTRLQHAFSTMQRQSELGHSTDNLMCFGLQWREYFEHRVWTADAYQLNAWKNTVQQITARCEDTFALHDAPVALGAFVQVVSYSAVCDTATIGALSVAVRQFLEGLRYDEAVCYNVDLAVSESLTNVMLHAFPDGRPKPVILAVLAYQHGVGMLVSDLGCSIPALALERVEHQVGFDEQASLDGLPEGGMGLMFMRMLSRRFVYESEGGINTLWMIF